MRAAGQGICIAIEPASSVQDLDIFETCSMNLCVHRSKTVIMCIYTCIIKCLAH